MTDTVRLVEASFYDVSTPKSADTFYKNNESLWCEERVDDGFEFVGWDGVKLSKRVVVGVRSQRGVSDSLDRLLIDSSLEVSISAVVRIVSGW